MPAQVLTAGHSAMPFLGQHAQVENHNFSMAQAGFFDPRLIAALRWLARQSLQNFDFVPGPDFLAFLQ